MQTRGPNRAARPPGDAFRVLLAGLACLAGAACGPAGPPDAGADGAPSLASVRLALETQALPSGTATIELRLSGGGAEPRVVREPVRGVDVLLYLSGLAPGAWLAEVEGFDPAGRTILCGYGAVDLPPGETQSLRIPLVAAARCEPREASCDNDIDDDVDGVTDCADPDCEALVCGPGRDCGPLARCAAGVCVPGEPGDCDDGDPCTADACGPGGRCVHDPVVCDDGDACTTDSCDPARGCRTATISCDDGDACTADRCDAVTGCRHITVSCDDGDPCTVDACAPASGCTNAPDPACAANCGPVEGGCPAGFSCADDLCVAANGTLYVPGGSFTMGCDPANPDDILCTVFTMEQPQHGVSVSGFAMDSTEVKRGDYRACSDAGACDALATASVCGTRDAQPVNCAAWQDAADYCAWAGGRLCTEAEWEYAARGSDGRLRPWGDEPASCAYAHLAEQASPNHGCGTGATADVGSYPAGASPFGVLDLIGNVSEWTADFYGATYYASSPAVDPPGPASGDRHVLRGGNYLQTDPFFARASDRAYGSDVDLDDGQDGFGIRCCRDLSPCALLGDGAPCDDGDPCTKDSTCQAGACGGGAPLCDDGDGCTADACDAGTCSHVALAEGALCDDGDPCWTGGRCTYGVCMPGETPLACDDGDDCTIDTCLRGVGCQHDACPAGTTCVASACVATHGPTEIELRHVPGGAFWMGCTPSADIPYCFVFSDVPLHGVTLSPFDVMANEVTVGQYLDCQLAGGCAGGTYCAPGFPASSYPDHPATCTNRASAAAYCAWAGLRLCTEAEWEKAARGPDGRSYPWGNTPPDCTVAVMNETGVGGGQGCGTAAIAPVGSRPAGRSPYGVLDLLGNAAEWVGDGYDASYYATGPTTDPQGPDAATLGVTRGALFTTPLTNPQFLFAWYRDPVDPTTGPFSAGRYGVRCCRDAPP